LIPALVVLLLLLLVSTVLRLITRWCPVWVAASAIATWSTDIIFIRWGRAHVVIIHVCSLDHRGRWAHLNWMHIYHMRRLGAHLVTILFRNFIIALTSVFIYHQANTETRLMLQFLTSLRRILIYNRLVLLSITLIYSIWILVILEETSDIFIWRVIR